MKVSKPILLVSFALTLALASVSAQNSPCKNIEFTQGNFTNWVGYTWQDSELYGTTTEPVEGIISRRHTIISDNNAYDPNTGNELKLLPPGHSYVAKLGDAIFDSDKQEQFRCWNQSLQYTLDIDENNALVLIKYAVVLQFDPDHTVEQEPRFRFSLYDSTGNIITNCANYEVYASDDNIEGFKEYNVSTGDGDESVVWKDWSTVGVDLSDYTGQSITIEFLAADCNQGFDYGYAYFTASCQPLEIAMSFCAGDTEATLTSPIGFNKYKWTDSDNNTVGSSQTLRVSNPQENAAYTCEMTSEAGCIVTLNTTITQFSPKASFNSEMLDCFSNTVQLNNSSSTNNGNLLYKWIFDDGEISNAINPQHTFLTSGRHQVSLVLRNPPSACRDTLKQEVESFSPPLVYLKGDTSYCSNESTYINAFGAYNYTWSNGSTADSIEVSAPGGDFWMVGHSSTGCISDTHHISISEEPEWELASIADTVICPVGDSAHLSTSGAHYYLWNTGDTSNYIYASKAGEYSCIGTNLRGCQKSESFSVFVSPFPDSTFTLSTHTLTTKENTLSGQSASEDQVEYFWNLDDGTDETGDYFNHYYTINYNKLFYKIRLTATNIHGCTSTSSDIVNIVPFVPNIFSPNGDGVNDIFMPGIDLQIFDRAGVILYKGTEGWDGTYNGKPVDPDTYFYTIFYHNIEEQKKNIKGYLTLVR